MQIRIVRLNSRNPLVAILVIAVIVALLAFLFTAGLALAVGGAVLGAVGYLVRRVVGGQVPRDGGRVMEGERVVVLGEEVFPDPRPGDVRSRRRRRSDRGAAPARARGIVSRRSWMNRALPAVRGARSRPADSRGGAHSR
ncbi:MAG: hypothetical protein IPF47_21690 [Gemmatimonadetes bacterium]|nr:hypothetical protein [Gemmatimonadota bacterium]